MPEYVDQDWLLAYHVSRMARRETARRVQNFSTRNRTRMPFDRMAEKLANERFYSDPPIELGEKLLPVVITDE